MGFISGARVEKTVVQAVGTALPELDFLRNNAVAAPPGGERDLAVGEFAFHFLELGFQERAGSDDGALGRNPGAKLAAAGACQEVGEGLGGGDFFSGAGHDDLALEKQPGKKHRNVGVFGDVAGFAAGEVGEKNEAAFIVAFEENGSDQRAARGTGGGETHGIGFDDAVPAGLAKPKGELGEGIGVEVRFVEGGAPVFVALEVDVHLAFSSATQARMWASKTSSGRAPLSRIWSWN